MAHRISRGGQATHTSIQIRQQRRNAHLYQRSQTVTVIINYCASLHVVTSTSFTEDPHPVLLNVTDNMSSLSWTTGACKKSKIGCRLARLFCSLPINSPLGINSQWISTVANKIANDISCLKNCFNNILIPHMFGSTTFLSNRGTRS